MKRWDNAMSGVYLTCFELQVTILLSTYILRNKQRFFDRRNIKLAIVTDDLLGKAFGVNAFHRCQVNNLLRGQIIPYRHETRDQAVVYGSPGCGVTVRHISSEAAVENIADEDDMNDDDTTDDDTDDDTGTDDTIMMINGVPAGKRKQENVMQSSKKIRLLERRNYIKPIKANLKPENKKVFDSLSKRIQEKEAELECPVCFEICQSPIYSCGREDHLICSSCYRRLSKCPQCRERYTVNPKIHRYAEKFAVELMGLQDEIAALT